MSRPNIIYIHSHDSGRYVSPYGHAMPTPNIQKLAEGGVLFRQAFSVAPTCSPSRAGLLTGQCAHSAGMLGLVNRGFVMPSCDKHIVNTMRQAGYRSALIGVQHVAKNPAEIGYDEVIPTEDRYVASVAPAAADFIAQAPDDQPFWLTVGFFETHRVYPKHDARDDPRYVAPPLPLPDTPRTREDMADYRASVREYDRGVGLVMDALEKRGIADNTLVICTTDHGLAFPAMKCALTDHGFGVMLIVRGPSGFTGGKVVDGMVSHVDVFPTLCEWVGLEAPEWLHGRSMMPLVRGEVDEINDEVYAEVTYHAAYEPKRCVRTKRWKYIRRYGSNDMPVMPNCDDGCAKTEWLEHGWRERPLPTEQLYDLMFDPVETHNLAGDSSAAHILKDMRRRLGAWMERTDDPLLRGPVPLPEGCYASDPADLQPFDLWDRYEKPEGYA